MVVESEAKQPGIQGKPEPEDSSSAAPAPAHTHHTKQKRKQYRSKKKKEMKMEDGNRCGLVEYGELPEYMKENEYILGYYRSEWPVARAALSLFSWHNETLNVWTHLLGFLLFLGLTLLHLDRAPPIADILRHLPWSVSPISVRNVSSTQSNFSNGASQLIKLETSVELHHNHHHPSPTAARWPFFVFLFGSMFCLLTSSICHLFCCHSHRLTLLLSRLDYVGIAVMIVASFFPPIYYIFQCEPHWQLAYLAAITAMGVFTVLTLLAPHFSTGAFRAYRALLFVAMGLSGLVPAVHAVVVNWSEPRRAVTLGYEAAMAVSYLTGTFFYVSRIPERWRPGWFDLTGHSHQIFHVFVIAGALAHYGAALIFLQWRDTVGC